MTWDRRNGPAAKLRKTAGGCDRKQLRHTILLLACGLSLNRQKISCRRAVISTLQVGLTQGTGALLCPAVPLSQAGLNPVIVQKVSKLRLLRQHSSSSCKAPGLTGRLKLSLSTAVCDRRCRSSSLRCRYLSQLAKIRLYARPSRKSLDSIPYIGAGSACPAGASKCSSEG